MQSVNTSSLNVCLCVFAFMLVRFIKVHIKYALKSRSLL